MEQYFSYSLEDTEEIAANFARTLSGGEIIAFTGSMGAGKTAFTRGFVKALGGGDVVSSPTFAIVNEYNADFPIKHFDMYRIHGFEDLYSTGFFDYQEQDNAILLIEWSENIEDFLPSNTIKIDIAHGEEENMRKITITR